MTSREQQAGAATRSAARGATDWWRAAACQSADPDLFFPVSSTGFSLEQTAQAKSVCAACIVRRQCLDYALATEEPHGVWGGMTGEERKRAARRSPAATERLGAATPGYGPR
jgi:WhiB family redox-sensing transcriptional regulator